MAYNMRPMGNYTMGRTEVVSEADKDGVPGWLYGIHDFFHGESEEKKESKEGHRHR